jgi:O-antigen/teichoic acid export membrane protein
MDLIIVTWMFGAGEAAVYGTALRVFTLIGATQAAFTYPLWAAYGEAAARKDHTWLARVFKQSLRISLMWSIPSAFAVFIATPLLFKLLVTSDVIPNWRLSLAIMTTEIVNSVARCISSFLNGLGAVRLQAIFGPIGGVSNLSLSLALGSLLGPSGVAWATCICLLIFWVGVMGLDSIKRMRAFSTA